MDRRGVDGANLLIKTRVCHQDFFSYSVHERHEVANGSRYARTYQTMQRHPAFLIFVIFNALTCCLCLFTQNIRLSWSQSGC